MSYNDSVGKAALDAVTRNRGIGGLSDQVVSDAFKFLQNKVNRLESARSTGQSIGETFDSSGDVLSLDPAKRLSEVYRQLREQQYQFFREGGAQYDKLNNEITKLGDAFREVSNFSERFYGNARDGKAVMGELYQSFRGFVGVSRKTATELGKLAVGFKRLGLDTREFGRVLDNAALSYGLNEKQLLSMSTALYDLRENFKMSPNEIAQNFQTAQKTFAYSADKMMNVFTKLQKTSRQTGVQFGTLTSAFGDTMDTFQGSANVAGKLNAVLGKSVFNSMDLLRKTESERMETIVQGLQRSLGRNISQVGKFELKAIAASMGVSVDDARRLLMNKGNIRENIEKVIKSPEQKLGDSISKNVDVTKQLTEANYKLLDSFKNLISPGERFRMEAGEDFSIPKGRGFAKVLIQQALIRASDQQAQRDDIKKLVNEFVDKQTQSGTPMDMASLAGLLFQQTDPNAAKNILKKADTFDDALRMARAAANTQSQRGTRPGGTRAKFTNMVVQWYKGATVTERQAFDNLRKQARARGGAALEQAASIAYIRAATQRGTGAGSKNEFADEIYEEGFNFNIDGTDKISVPAPGKAKPNKKKTRTQYEQGANMSRFQDSRVLAFSPGVNNNKADLTMQAQRMAAYGTGQLQAEGFLAYIDRNITDSSVKTAVRALINAALKTT